VFAVPWVAAVLLRTIVRLWWDAFLDIWNAVADRTNEREYWSHVDSEIDDFYTDGFNPSGDFA
jgi:hypothetical protein